MNDLFDLHDIEMLLNYFPHAIWRESNQPDVMSNREKFYWPLVYKIDKSWDHMNDE
jgi:hypothetical protein